ncbi:hypothetical protein D918_00901 [Trichuris suis]|nr:hypothetical protein D918_00901 [Trichuris suis]
MNVFSYILLYFSRIADFNDHIENRCLRPAEWIPSQTVFARTVLCSSEPTREYIQGTTSSFAPKRVMRYTKRECYVKAITSPYFTTRNRNRYSTKTIVESKVALRENISQHGPTKPSMVSSYTR